MGVEAGDADEVDVEAVEDAENRRAEDVAVQRRRVVRRAEFRRERREGKCFSVAELLLSNPLVAAEMLTLPGDERLESLRVLGRSGVAQRLCTSELSVFLGGGVTMLAAAVLLAAAAVIASARLFCSFKQHQHAENSVSSAWLKREPKSFVAVERRLVLRPLKPRSTSRARS